MRNRILQPGWVCSVTFSPRSGWTSPWVASALCPVAGSPSVTAAAGLPGVELIIQNGSDEDATKWIKIFTLLDPSVIEGLIAEHAAAPQLRILQKALAAELTKLVHSEADLTFAIQAPEILFGNATTEVLKSLNEAQLLQVMEGVPTVNITLAQLTEGYDLVSLLADTQIFPSKGEARKMWQSGGISINKEKIGTDFTNVTTAQLLQGKYILLQKGKKNYYLVIAA